MALGLEDVKERLSSEASALWEQLQESSLYQQLRDKYENLSPVMQKLVLFGGIATLIAMLSSVPAGFFSNSNDSITSFEDKRNLVRDLLKVSRDANDAPDIPVPPDMNALKSRIEANLLQAQLMPDQNGGVQIVSENSTLVPSTMSQGVLKVSLAKLNLRQVLDLGYQIQSISPSVKMLGMEMTANLLKPQYFDVVYKVMALNVPQLTPTTEAEEPPKGSKRGNARPKAKSGGSEAESAENN